MRLVAEILHRLEVEQAVDGLVLRVVVGVVHRPAEPDAPVGEAEGEPDVERHRHQRDACEAPVEQAPQDADDQQHFEQGRDDVEHRQAQHRLDPAGATLDRARQPAGLPIEVEPQAEAVQVLERLQRHLADRALLHRGEHRVAQLGEPGGGDAQHRIGHDQPQRNGERVVLGRQRIHGVAVNDGDIDRRDLRQDQQHDGRDHAHVGADVPPGP